MASEANSGVEQRLPHPALKAILLCDRLIQEAATDKVTIVGVVDRLTASEFPFEYVRGLELYVRVIDAAGEYPIRMEIVRVADEHTIGRGEAVVSIPDRMNPYDLQFDLPRIPFEFPGQYEFRVFANGRFVSAAVLLIETSL